MHAANSTIFNDSTEAIPRMKGLDRILCLGYPFEVVCYEMVDHEFSFHTAINQDRDVCARLQFLRKCETNAISVFVIL